MRWRYRILVALALLGLIAFTAWNLTHSSALEEAAKAYSRGDLTGGLEHALTHLSRQPWSHAAALLAANCLSRLDYSEEAEPYYRRAGRLSLADSQIRAYGLARGPHPERAIPAYNEILVRSPENVTALRRLAAVLIAHGRTGELNAVAERLIAIPGGVVIGETLRATVFHNEGTRKWPRRPLKGCSSSTRSFARCRCLALYSGPSSRTISFPAAGSRKLKTV
jgi:tetratricopeptide (TPR) repeat protein